MILENAPIFLRAAWKLKFGCRESFVLTELLNPVVSVEVLQLLGRILLKSMRFALVLSPTILMNLIQMYCGSGKPICGCKGDTYKIEHLKVFLQPVLVPTRCFAPLYFVEQTCLLLQPSFGLPKYW